MPHFTASRIARLTSMAVVLGWSWAAVGVHAQVVRCTDERTGQVTYTDGTCARGNAVQEVQAAKTLQQIQQERALAAQALELKQQRLQQEALQAQANEQAQRAADAQRQRERATLAPVPPSATHAQSAQCAQSRRQLQAVFNDNSRDAYEMALRTETLQRQVDLDCLGPQAYAELERLRTAQQPLVISPSATHRPNGGPALFPQQPFPTIGRPERPRRLTECGDFRCTDNRGESYPRVGPGRFPGQGGVCRSNGGQAPC